MTKVRNNYDKYISPNVSHGVNEKKTNFGKATQTLKNISAITTAKVNRVHGFMKGEGWNNNQKISLKVMNSITQIKKDLIKLRAGGSAKDMQSIHNKMDKLIKTLEKLSVDKKLGRLKEEVTRQLDDTRNLLEDEGASRQVDDLNFGNLLSIENPLYSPDAWSDDKSSSESLVSKEKTPDVPKKSTKKAPKLVKRGMDLFSKNQPSAETLKADFEASKQGHHWNHSNKETKI